MRYISTRDKHANESFKSVVLKGLSQEGGLFVPLHFPDLSEFNQKNLSYQAIATAVFSQFMAPDFSVATCKELVDKSYQSFREDDVVLIKQYQRFSVLELFHGPTLAFKDIALQFLGQVLNHLNKTNTHPVIVLGATSGDTGGAAISGLAGVEGCKVFMLYPEGRVSHVQELQMTRIEDDNVFPIAISGSFDDAQNIVKQLFNDPEIVSQFNFTAVNSINWCRIMAQMAYYFYASHNHSFTQPPNMVVPTGNFGNILAGFYAKKCGAKLDKLVIACNENDLLWRLFQTGRFQPFESKLTLSPAMDIQISSNFERLLFELSDRDSNAVAEQMASLQSNGYYQLSSVQQEKFHQHFHAEVVLNDETSKMMLEMAQANCVVDPHTAVGMVAAEKSGLENCLCLSTAHPLKFSEAVAEHAKVQLELPESIKALEKKSDKKVSLENDINTIKSFILKKV